MGNRLTRIYTRTGDDGTTGLGDGSRRPKDDPRIEAIGAVDELNSIIGLVRGESLPDGIDAALATVQHRLFDLGAGLSLPGGGEAADPAAELEAWLDRLNAQLPPLREFILPGGTRAAGLCHLARSVCRRAERRVYTLRREDNATAPALVYLNRLSDLLFVIARHLNRAAGVEDVMWIKEREE